MSTGEDRPEVFFGDVWYEANGQFGPRTQMDYQLVVVHLGSARVVRDGESCEITPGTVALLLPGRQEYFRFARGHRTHHTWCAVRPDLPAASLRRKLARLPAVLPQSRTFDLLMRAAFQVPSWREPEGRQMLRVLGLAVLEEYLRMAQEGVEGEDRESPAVRGRHYLEEHCAEQDSLARAAGAAGVTAPHLIRLFRAQYGITPGRYLWQMRVERGAGLLVASGLTVAQIADRCGFKNPFHFSRLLRRMQGVSPRELRRRAWARK